MPVLQQRHTAERGRQQISQQTCLAGPAEKLPYLGQIAMRLALLTINPCRQWPAFLFGKSPDPAPHAAQRDGQMAGIQLPGIAGGIRGNRFEKRRPAQGRKRRKGMTGGQIARQMVALAGFGLRQTGMVTGQARRHQPQLFRGAPKQPPAVHCTQDMLNAGITHVADAAMNLHDGIDRPGQQRHGLAAQGHRLCHTQLCHGRITQQGINRGKRRVEIRQQ